MVAFFVYAFSKGKKSMAAGKYRMEGKNYICHFLIHPARPPKKK
jgi:hypothetical protein